MSKNYATISLKQGKKAKHLKHLLFLTFHEFEPDPQNITIAQKSQKTLHVELSRALKSQVSIWI